jgi:hypothetical protein
MAPNCHQVPARPQLPGSDDFLRLPGRRARGPRSNRAAPTRPTAPRSSRLRPPSRASHPVIGRLGTPSRSVASSLGGSPRTCRGLRARRGDRGRDGLDLVAHKLSHPDLEGQHLTARRALRELERVRMVCFTDANGNESRVATRPSPSRLQRPSLRERGPRVQEHLILARSSARRPMQASSKNTTESRA